MGLTPGASYQDTESGIVYEANALMTVGLPIPMKLIPAWNIEVPAGEYEAFQIHLCRT